MEGIAARAGVGKATLYRRWKSREDVVAAAVADFVADIAIPDTGSVEEDLLLLERRAVAVYRGRPGRILPGLLAAMASSAEVAHAVRTRFLEGRRAALASVLARGVARGELRSDLDVELALDFLGGPLFYRLLVTGGPLDDTLASGVVTTMLHGMTRRAPGREEEA
jgi:AcrR family transcriptional regulator